MSKSGLNIVKGGVETVLYVSSLNPKSIVLGTVNRTTGAIVMEVVKNSALEEKTKADLVCNSVICVEDEESSDAKEQISEKDIESVSVTESSLEPVVLKSISTDLIPPVEESIPVVDSSVEQAFDFDVEWIRVDSDKDHGENQ